MGSSGGRWLLLLVTLGSLPAGAIEVGEGKLSINGFGSWGYGDSNGNNYTSARHAGNFDSGEFGLALTTSLSDQAVVAAQLRYTPDGGGLFLDWAFGEWRFSDRFRLRMGLLKHPLGIFGEVPNVGTLRPFFVLPRGIYGQTEMTGSGVEGASISGLLFSQGSWEASYDLYGGSLKLRVQDVIGPVTKPASLTPGGAEDVQTFEAKYVLGGRIVVATPLEGLEARLSTYGSPVKHPDNPRFVIGPSLQYTGERFSARAEYFFYYEQNYQRTHTAYVEAAWFLTRKVQVGARAELYDLHVLEAPVRSSLFEHKELAATVNYWFDPGLVVKLSVHAVDGNRFAQPTVLDDALLNGTLKRSTLATILGMQFSF
jgi:hypothetical protein